MIQCLRRVVHVTACLALGLGIGFVPAGHPGVYEQGVFASAPVRLSFPAHPASLLHNKAEDAPRATPLAARDRPAADDDAHTAARSRPRDLSSCLGPFLGQNGTAYTLGNEYVYWSFDFDPNNPGSGVGFPGNLYFDAGGNCNYSYTNIEGSIALSFVENGTRYVYGTPNGEYGAWWNANTSNIPAGTITGALMPLQVTQESAAGQVPLVLTASFMAGNVEVDWTFSLASGMLNAPYSVKITAPSTQAVQDVSFYHAYDLDDLNGGDSSPGADGLYQNGQIGSVNSLAQGIGIGGVGANWDLSVEDEQQQSASNTFQKIVSGAPFNDYPSGIQYATAGAGADGGLQFPVGALSAGASATVAGNGGGTRNYGAPPAPQVSANDENWIATNANPAPAMVTSITVHINRFYGALVQDPQIVDTSGSIMDGQLVHPEFVKDGLGKQRSASVQLEVYGTEGLPQPAISPCPANSSGTCPLIGTWEADPTALGWSIFTANGVPAEDLFFPNLNLTSSQGINPPYAAPNTFVLDGGGHGVSIAWARIQEIGVRPVVLVHGIHPGLDANILRDGAGALLGDASPQGMSGWGTWQCWTSSTSCSVNGQTSSNYLASIGVPNIRPQEENISAASQGPTSDNPANPGHYPSDIRAYVSTSAHYWVNAQGVINQIAMVRTRYGVDSVNVVTHSKGGIDSSDAVQSAGASVAHLIMLAPPYIGTPLADYLASRPILGGLGDTAFDALQDLTLQYWEDVEPAGLTPNPDTVDYALAGTNAKGVVPDPLDNAAFGYDCIPFTVVNCAHIYTNDGAVPVFSAQAVPGQFLGTTNNNHLTINQDPAVFDQVKPLLDLSSEQSTQQSTGLVAARARYIARVSSAVTMPSTATGISTTVRSVAFGPLVGGTAPAASSISQSVTLDTNAATHETLIWDTGTVSMTLVDPDGHSVTSQSAGVTYTATLNPSGGGMLDYGLPSPTPGAWTAIITNTTPSGTAVNYQLSTSFVSPVTLAVPRSPLVYQPNASVPFTVTLFNGATPVSGALVTATAVLSGTIPVTISLVDQGSGTYASTFAGLTLPGQYSVHLSATGTVEGVPFVSTGLSFVTISGGNAALSGNYTEGTVPGPDGLYAAVVITPSIQVTVPGSYHLQGTLVDSAGNIIATAGSDATLSSGLSQDLGLSFPAHDFVAAQVNGPYQLRNVILIDNSSSNADIEDAVLMAYTTSAYTVSQFERPLLSILPGTTDMPISPLGTGQFGGLAIVFTTTVALPDTYQIIASLTSSQGQTISVITETAQLSANPTKVTLIFPGADIAAQQINGPYLVTGMTIVPESDPTRYVSYPGFMSTHAYSASAFSGPPPASATTTPNLTPPAPTNTLTAPTNTPPVAAPTATPTNTPPVAAPTATPTNTFNSKPSPAPVTSTPTATATTFAGSGPTMVASTVTPINPSPVPLQSTPTATSLSTGTTKIGSHPHPPVACSRQTRSLPLTLAQLPRSVASLKTLVVTGHTKGSARIAITLEVHTVRIRYIRKGKRQRRVQQTVVLYRTTTRSAANRRGTFVVRLYVSYRISKPASALVLVTATENCQHAVRDGTINLVPRHVRVGHDHIGVHHVGKTRTAHPAVKHSSKR